jgi:hypothetical protein
MKKFELIKCIDIGVFFNSNVLTPNLIYLVSLSEIPNGYYYMLLDDGTFDGRGSPTFEKIS